MAKTFHAQKDHRGLQHLQSSLLKTLNVLPLEEAQNFPKAGLIMNTKDKKNMSLYKTHNKNIKMKKN